jgi:hypothetical protein
MEVEGRLRHGFGLNCQLGEVIVGDFGGKAQCKSMGLAFVSTEET